MRTGNKIRTLERAGGRGGQREERKRRKERQEVEKGWKDVDRNVLFILAFVILFPPPRGLEK